MVNRGGGGRDGMGMSKRDEGCVKVREEIEKRGGVRECVVGGG